MQKKKSQNSLELLFSYGWLLLGVLLVISVLGAYGILNPDRYLPDKADAGPGIRIIDAEIDEENATVLVQNALGTTIFDLNINFTECNNSRGVLSSSYTITAGDIQKITVICNSTTPGKTKFQSDLKVKYATRTAGSGYSLNHSTSGILRWTRTEGSPTYEN